MPNQTEYIGTLLTAYVPMADDLIDLGYTNIRFYTATSEGGTYTQRDGDSVSLVAGTYDYSYNYTSGVQTDWFYWIPYGATPGEGTASETIQCGPSRTTRKVLRQDVGAFLSLMEGSYTLAGASSSTVATLSELIDADRDVDTVGGRFARCVGGTASGQTRRILKGSTGYTNLGTGEITVNRAFSPAWVTGDEIELWLPEDDADPSVLVELAMQTVRPRVAWDELFYLSTDSNVTVYNVPFEMSESSIRRVEYVAGTYPDRPSWEPVPKWTLEGGLIDVSASPTGKVAFSADTVIRVLWSRPGDRMNSDTDYWEVDREWAMLETALAFQRRKSIGLGNDDDSSDAIRSIRVIEDLLRPFRFRYSPAGAGEIQGPR